MLFNFIQNNKPKIYNYYTLLRFYVTKIQYKKYSNFILLKISFQILKFSIKKVSC